jgi:hydrogenase maturation protease
LQSEKNHPAMSLKQVLIFAYGNISRGDDALAPLMIDKLQSENITTGCGHPVKYLTDYQIQVEHILDMQGCERVLLIDAHLALETPYTFQPLHSCLETSYTTHGMSPSTLLYTYEKTLGSKSPPGYLLALRGQSFELGESLSERSKNDLELALNFCKNILLQDDFRYWEESLQGFYASDLC